jgi:hypothetical protein
MAQALLPMGEGLFFNFKGENFGGASAFNGDPEIVEHPVISRP